MIVYVMRHGQAEDLHRKGDSARELTAAGRSAVMHIGERFRNENHPLMSVVASPFVRTRQTADAFLDAEEFRTDGRLASGSSPEAMFEVVGESELPVLIVGHMPDVGQLVSYLTAGSSVAHFVFEPATIACVRFLGSPRPGAGALTWMRLPSQW